ncbi:hypothetical protein [Sediminibacterium goheungense]|uniref:Uncharacterized protein n=1 Tax=Sediminibacterium goheungense TaxID=1086393 RepID=A0A4R6J2R1_9BACT|nr:hypothetical protein [Sediminibacterium goheungense]TDO28556.1 hypothetical protein BC659_0627 [Sediminibacterium goheungense]
MKVGKSLLTYLCIAGLLLMGLETVSAQATHYLFFQTENNRPFYLRIMGSTLSSNASGYLLIPKLTDGKYEIHIGFAQSEEEQQYEISVEGKDLGFSLKQELDNTWSLFNLVDFSQQKGKTIAVLPKPQVKKEEEPVADVKAKEIPQLPLQNPVKPADTIAKVITVAEQPLAPKKKNQLPLVQKIYDKSSPEGVDMVFVVNGVPKNDTVILYVPVIKPPGMARVNGKNQEIPAYKSQPAPAAMLPSFINHTFKTP